MSPAKHSLFAGLAFSVSKPAGCALHVTGGEFDLVTAFAETGVMEMFGGDFNVLTFPEINILLVYVAFPVAAVMGRRNPVVGLTPYGFMLVNGLTHLVGGSVLGGAPLANPGDVIGLLCFIPLFAWFFLVCVKEGLLDRRGLACAVAAGVVQRLGVFSVYAVNLAAGSAAAMAWVPFMSCIGIALAWAPSGTRSARQACKDTAASAAEPGSTR